MTIQEYIGVAQFGDTEKTIKAIFQSQKVAGDMTAEQLNSYLYNFFSKSGLDRLAGLNFPINAPYSVSYESNTFVENSGTNELAIIGRFFPKADVFYKHIANTSLSQRDLYAFLNQSIFNNFGSDFGGNRTTFLSFLQKFGANRVYPVFANRVGTIPSILDIKNFVANNEDMKVASTFFANFVDAIAFVPPTNMSKEEFNAAMADIFATFGWGVWRLNLDIVKQDFDYIATEDTIKKFKAAFISDDQLEDLIGTLNVFYKTDQAETFNITLATKLYKDLIGY